MIEGKSPRQARPGTRFEHRGLVAEPVVAILCRDPLRHLPLESGQEVLENFRRSGSRWLIASTYPEVTRNEQIADPVIGSRPLNLELPPFSLPRAIEVFTERQRQQSGALADLLPSTRRPPSLPAAGYHPCRNCCTMPGDARWPTRNPLRAPRREKPATPPRRAPQYAQNAACMLTGPASCWLTSTASKVPPLTA